MCLRAGGRQLLAGPQGAAELRCSAGPRGTHSHNAAALLCPPVGWPALGQGQSRPHSCNPYAPDGPRPPPCISLGSAAGVMTPFLLRLKCPPQPVPGRPVSRWPGPHLPLQSGAQRTSLAPAAFPSGAPGASVSG